MYVPVEQLIDGVVLALREEVLPAVTSARARGRLWAALDVLNNLRDRVEPKAWLLAAEAESAAEALEACAAALRRAEHPADADAVASDLAAAPTLAGGAGIGERATALRVLVARALRRLDVLGDEASSARAPLESHLASQALRDVMMVKPSLLTEISKG
jgi:hypothetical protein